MEDRANVLRAMKICRFCLREDAQLSNIYEKQNINVGNSNRQTVPLPLQLMACVSIEVFSNDGMPQLICTTCRTQTLQAYTFKTNCKKADDALKVFLATGALVKPWTQDDLEEQNKTAVQAKRPLSPRTPRSKGPFLRTKRAKPSELITLNYSASGLNHQSTSTMDKDDSTSADQFEDQGQSADSDGEREESKLEDDEYLPDPDDEEDDKDSDHAEEQEIAVNPTLQVNQVMTDCFPCPHCERSFPLRQLLELHKANHKRERKFTCDECDKSFFTKYDLSKHFLTHTGDRGFNCVVCHKSFSRQSLLRRHEKIHTDVPIYLCPQCDKTFLTGDDLDAHAAKHKKKRPFSCKICNKSFVFKQGLERHEVSHSNVKPHKCNYCEASFCSAIKLTRHVTSHAGLRPYPCKICGRTFLLSHHLTRHMRSHYAAQQPEAFIPPIGQHKCDICSMSFRRKDSLINHSAIHSMVNLKCVICNTEFDNVIKVKEHITTHLSELPFPCDKCDYSFESSEQLEDHELKHAEMEYEEQIEQEVIAEARQAAGQGTGDEGDEEYSGDEIAEFTITNDLDNPEVVRRSSRSTKVKNYADFLKDEVSSDVEEVQEVAENNEDSENDESQSAPEEDVIKPIVRSEGTKVYSRRSQGDGPKPRRSLINLAEVQTAPLSAITQVNPIDQLTATKDLNKLPDKEIFNMKIGDKTVMVQKLLLTKDQMKAMAKEGKIEKKGNTYLLKKSPGQTFQTLNFESLVSKSNENKSMMYKSYQKRSGGSSGGNNEPNIINSIVFDHHDTSMDDSISNI